VHFHKGNKSAPDFSDMTISIVFVLAIMAKWDMEILDIKGTVLHPEFANDAKDLLESFSKIREVLPSNVIFLLLTTLYGLKQAALVFLGKLVLTMVSIGMSRSKADPSLYFTWFFDFLCVCSMI
jgi:hypothetical protein